MNTQEKASPGTVLLILPVLILLVLFFGSVIHLFSNGFYEDGEFSTRYFRQIANRSDYHVVFLRTILSSLTVGDVIPVMLWNRLFLQFPIPWSTVLLGIAVGMGVGITGSLLPATAARRVRVSDVFAKIA